MKYISIEDIAYNSFTDFVIALILFWNIFFISYKFKNIYKKTDNNYATILNINYLIIILSIIFFYISLLGFKFVSIKKILYAFNFISLIFSIYDIKKNKLLSQSFKFNDKYYLYTTIFLLFYLVLSLSPVSDSDSLDYHLGLPLDIIKNGSFQPRYDWTHFGIFGPGEFFILYGLFNGTTVLGQVLNFYSLFAIIFLILKNNNHNLENKKNVYFYILSAPIFLWLVYSSKIILFPILLIFIIFDHFFKTKKISNFQIIYLAVYLSFILVCKISFAYEVLVICILLLIFKFEKKFFLKFISYSIPISLLILFPIFYTKYLFFSDIAPPFLEIYKAYPDYKLILFKKTLVKDLQDFSSFALYKFFLLPFIMIITEKSHYFTSLLGIGFLGIYFVFIKKNFLKKILVKPEFCFVILMLLLLFFSKNLQPRYYVSAYLVFALVLFELNSEFKNNFFYIVLFKLVKIQFFVVLFFLISASLFFFSSRFINTVNLKSLFVYNLNVANWIHENIPKNKIISFDYIRSHALLKNRFISRKEIFYSKTRTIEEYTKDFKKYKIDYLILLMPLNESMQNLVEKCASDKKILRKKFIDERRNMFQVFFQKKYKTFMLIENKCK